jgi:hypothetical protein
MHAGNRPGPIAPRAGESVKAKQSKTKKKTQAEQVSINGKPRTTLSRLVPPF